MIHHYSQVQNEQFVSQAHSEWIEFNQPDQKTFGTVPEMIFIHNNII